MYDKAGFPARAPAWLGDFHRLCGTIASLFSLPVAYHCLSSLGFKAHVDQARVFVHWLVDVASRPDLEETAVPAGGASKCGP